MFYSFHRISSIHSWILSFDNFVGIRAHSLRWSLFLIQYSTVRDVLFYDLFDLYMYIYTICVYRSPWGRQKYLLFTRVAIPGWRTLKILIGMRENERALIFVFLLCCKVRFGFFSHSAPHRTINRFSCMPSFYQVLDHYSHFPFLFSLFFLFFFHHSFSKPYIKRESMFRCSKITISSLEIAKDKTWKCE